MRYSEHNVEVESAENRDGTSRPLSALASATKKKPPSQMSHEHGTGIAPSFRMLVGDS